MDQACELYLRLGGDDLPSLQRLEDIVAASSPAAILIGKSLLEKPGNKGRLESLVTFIKRQNLAVLFEEDVQLTARLKADGVHLNGGQEKVRDGRASLGEEAYIGVSSPLSRHEAMVLGEAGASYVAFSADGAPFEALVEMTQWWAAIVELPCAVWLNADADEAQICELIKAGADYLAPEIMAETSLDQFALIGELMKSTG